MICFTHITTVDGNVVRDIDIFMLTETWLKAVDVSSLNETTPPGFSYLQKSSINVALCHGVKFPHLRALSFT
jgi:hypothetical protein